MSVVLEAKGATIVGSVTDPIVERLKEETRKCAKYQDVLAVIADHCRIAGYLYTAKDLADAQREEREQVTARLIGLIPYYVAPNQREGLVEAIERSNAAKERTAATELPKLADLHGMAPDLTGGVDSVEYVRRQRDADPEGSDRE